MTMSDHSFAFLSAGTFLNVPARNTDRPYGVAGVAYDGAVTNRPGARFGPDAIRQASKMLCDAIHPHFDTSPLDVLSDDGDLRLPNTSIDSMRKELEKLAPALIAKQHMCWLGGDHSITLPLLRVYRKHYGKPLAIVHFDAHCDTWKDHFVELSGHGTWVYEALQEKLIVPSATIQIGIRSSGVKEAREYVNSVGGKIYTARELRGMENPQQLAHVIADIKQRFVAAGNPPAYLTFDIDCLDPAFAPGTGTPEPGGLTTSQALTLVEGLHDIPFVGMDCCEVSPQYDHAELTSHAASVMVWTYLCGQIARAK